MFDFDLSSPNNNAPCSLLNISRRSRNLTFKKTSVEWLSLSFLFYSLNLFSTFRLLDLMKFFFINLARGRTLLLNKMYVLKSIFPSFCDVRNYRSDPDSARTYGSDRIRNPACISTSSIIAAKRVIPTVVFVIILSGLYPESHEITSPLFALWMKSGFFGHLTLRPKLRFHPALNRFIFSCS